MCIALETFSFRYIIKFALLLLKLLILLRHQIRPETETKLDILPGTFNLYFCTVKISLFFFLPLNCALLLKPLIFVTSSNSANKKLVGSQYRCIWFDADRDRDQVGYTI